VLIALHAERARLLNIVQQAPAFFALLEGPSHIHLDGQPSLHEACREPRRTGKSRLQSRCLRAAEQGLRGDAGIKFFATGEPVRGQAARFDVTWAEGQVPDERYVDFVYQPLREEDNSISGIIVLGVDVTENKPCSESAFVQNEKARGGWAAFPLPLLTRSTIHSEQWTNLLYLAGLASSMGEVSRLLHRAGQ